MFPLLNNFLTRVESFEKIYYNRIYLKIALFFIVIFSYAFLLSKITTEDDWVISSNKIQGGMLNNMIHFSFTTFTTTGYGDIYPATVKSRRLAHLLMFLAVFNRCDVMVPGTIVNFIIIYNYKIVISLEVVDNVR